MGQTTIVEVQSEEFNGETGLITNQRSHRVIKSSIGVTDEFVKVSKYLHTIFAFNGIPLNLVGISLCFAQRMEFKTNKLYLLKDDKLEIAEMLGFKPRLKKNGKPDTNTVDKLIRDAKKYDIIRPTTTRGVYEVNSYLFSTGSLADTRELQAHFDFERNEVVTTATVTNRITGETIKKAVTNARNGIPGQLSLNFNNNKGDENVEKDKN